MFRGRVSPVTVVHMEILSALFIEGIETRQVAGPSTRIDITGIQFSAEAEHGVPVTVEPHLCVIVHCPEGSRGTGALEVVYLKGDEQLARNVQPLQVEPGKFNYRLVRAELKFEEFGTIEAHCRIDMGPVTVVPFTLLPPTQ